MQQLITAMNKGDVSKAENLLETILEECESQKTPLFSADYVDNFFLMNLVFERKNDILCYMFRRVAEKYTKQVPVFLITVSVFEAWRRQLTENDPTAASTSSTPSTAIGIEELQAAFKKAQSVQDKVAEMHLPFPIEWYRQVKEQSGFEGAVQALGYCYEQGIGVSRDMGNAAKLYAKYRYKSLWMINKLDSLFRECATIPENNEEAIRFLKIGSELNYPLAWYNLAFYYEQGIGVETGADGFELAIDLYMKAADTNVVVKAKEKLFSLFVLNEGIDVEKMKVFLEKYRLSCQHPTECYGFGYFGPYWRGTAHSYVEYRLGLYYEIEQKDILKAVDCYIRAAKGQVVEVQQKAREKLDSFFIKGEMVPKDKQQAVLFWEKGALMDYPYRPGFCCELTQKELEQIKNPAFGMAALVNNVNNAFWRKTESSSASGNSTSSNITSGPIITMAPGK